MLAWVVGGAAVWMVSAVGVAGVLGAVIARADREDPFVDDSRMLVPTQRTASPLCDCPVHSAVS
ncbi:hypothetical protein GCM10017691_33350 [Pseudonocardia petroleophila]|uniref:Uncharacterized protein n=1 Tax=Pseudonocardia petroleophila TaxID=37331 RepID=A0A7G7MDK1_9PSEU|nr:hypothetical protein [Pseudonocardia petroleophila]QNG50862.1 hypothetical protein H6H00_22050 [Pseudonocardia petroleophila]